MYMYKVLSEGKGKSGEGFRGAQKDKVTHRTNKQECAGKDGSSSFQEQRPKRRSRELAFFPSVF